MKTVLLKLLSWVKDTKILHEIFIAIAEILVKKTDSPVDDLLLEELKKKVREK